MTLSIKTLGKDTNKRCEEWISIIINSIFQMLRMSMWSIFSIFKL